MCKKATVCYSDACIIDELKKSSNKSKFFVDAALFYIKYRDIESTEQGMTRDMVAGIAKDVVIDCLKGMIVSSNVGCTEYAAVPEIKNIDDDIMCIMDLDDD